MVIGVRAIRRFTVRTVLPPRLAALADLANNLRWSWHAETLDLFESIDPATWREVGRDPIKLLGQVTPERFARLAEDQQFLERLDAVAADLADYMGRDHWFQTEGGDNP